MRTLGMLKTTQTSCAAQSAHAIMLVCKVIIIICAVGVLTGLHSKLIQQQQCGYCPAADARLAVIMCYIQCFSWR